MDSNLLVYLIVSILVLGAGRGAFEEYQVNQCRVAYSSSARSAEEIAKICK